MRAHLRVDPHGDPSMSLDQPAGSRPVPTNPESVFAWAAPPVVFGRGALDETGAHVAALGARSVALVTDQGLVASGLADRATASLQRAGLEVACFDRVHGPWAAVLRSTPPRS
jgi:hypothetical protein